MDKPAGFLLRLLAKELDSFLLLIPHTLFWLYIVTSQSLGELVFRFLLYLMLTFLPLFYLSYITLLTYYFGGTLGKLLTGLRVVSDDKTTLTLKKVLFRQTVGYLFSTVIFGLGFLSIIKDPNKQAWHDKAVGTNVIKRQNLWPQALILLIILIAINSYLIFSAFKTATTNKNLQSDFQILVKAFNETKTTRQAPIPQKTKDIQATPSAAPYQTVGQVTINEARYNQSDIDTWKKDIDYYDQTLDYFNKNGSSFDQAKLTRLIAMVNELRAIAANIYRKMLANQPLTSKDLQDIQNYDKTLYPQEQQLLKELEGQ